MRRRSKLAATLLAAFLIMGQVTACSHGPSGRADGSDSDGWFDNSTLLVAGVAVLSVLVAGFVAANQSE